VILDEAQNTTPMQMRMFLTRLGEGSRMVVTGDPSQTDLPGGQRSGLADAVETLKDVNGVRFVRLTSKDVVRHDLVTRIVEAYDARDKKQKPTHVDVVVLDAAWAKACPASSGWCAGPRARRLAPGNARSPWRWRTTGGCGAEQARSPEGQADQRSVLSVRRSTVSRRYRAGAPDRLARGAGAEEGAAGAYQPSRGARHAASDGL
jgi:hypothetical protein